MCTKPLKYTFQTQVYMANQQVDVDPRCNAISVRNDGTSSINFMGDTLAAGESKSIGGNFAEILDARVYLSFTGAGVNKAVVTQKFYLAGQWLDTLMV